MDEAVDEPTSGASAAPSAVGSGIGLTDSSLPVTTRMPRPQQREFSSIAELAAASDTVVVATLRHATRSFWRQSAPDEGAGPGPAIDYDGLEFTVDEVLAGDLSVGDPLTLAIPSIVTWADGTTERLESDHSTLLARGLDDAPGRHRYLLFSGVADPFPVVLPTSPAGITEIDADGRVVLAWPGGPLSAPTLTLEMVRDELSDVGAATSTVP